jgi:hypothetical protein
MNIIFYLLFFIFYLNKCYGKYGYSYDLSNFYPKDFQYYSPKCVESYDKAIMGIIQFSHLSPKEKYVVELMLHFIYYDTIENKNNSDRFYQNEPPKKFPNINCYIIDRKHFLDKIINFSILAVFIWSIIFIVNIIFSIIFFLLPYAIMLIPP